MSRKHQNSSQKTKRFKNKREQKRNINTERNKMDTNTTQYDSLYLGNINTDF